MNYSLQQRAELYNETFPMFPGSHLRASDRWIDGTWVFGNDYRGSGYYGSYPPSYVRRVMSMFPDAQAVLHLFGGSIVAPRAAGRLFATVDIRLTPVVKPTVQGNAELLPFMDESFDLILADTPYTDTDAAKYETKMPSRKRAFEEAHRVLKPGGYLIWMDLILPMFAKVNWHWCIAISCWRSTNHRIRGVSGFQKVINAAR